MDYNKTLNLPTTNFPMRASLPKREPEILSNWTESKLYEKLMEKNKEKPLFLLHDGPPFSNNDIHVGTALNKILKDFVIRYKNMSGFKAPFVPGWDNHGMPIESAIIQKNKLDRTKMSIPEFRAACQKFAQHYVDCHREQFMRLGVIGDWEHPYLTMDPAFEGEEIKVFGKMAKKGYIYRGLKPVYWCVHDATALAEAEIEYQDQPCDTIYVKFQVKDDRGLFSPYGDISKMYFVIWTTTTWTLPGNLAICLNPELDYVLCKADNEVYIIADVLKESVAKSAGWDNMEILAVFKGRKLEGITASHPFLDRESLVIIGEHVTGDSGTGCVHTAPGHGLEDYYAAQKYNLPILVPVNDKGVMTDEAGPFAGLYYEKANAAIFEALKSSGALLAHTRVIHPYPHCWRCRKPILFRATEQWFASVDAIKSDALAVVDNVRWIPQWGHDRMASMISERADWCISRQRHWGLPIPIFYCKECGEILINDDTIEAVSTLFSKEGSNSWYIRPAEEILPAGTSCPKCGHGSFIKETNTLDGWFDSGSSHAAVLKRRPELSWPCDLYLEGADQYRGWFQSSMLTAVATEGKAPYHSVVTHGWVVDGEGKKMSKSLGNVLNPIKICDKYGADILRLWVASSDYHCDIRISEAIFKQLSEIYLKIRNTCRFLLSNLYDFNPNECLENLTELDMWALWRLDDLTARVRSSYERYEYHTIFHAIHNFCVIDMSNFYLDIIKDRLYCENASSHPRRSAQTAMYRILDTLVRLLAPVLAFTSEELWKYMPHSNGADPTGVLFNDMPSPTGIAFAHAEKWEKLIDLRDQANKALELARTSKTIGKSLEAALNITARDHDFTFLQQNQSLLCGIFMVSQVSISQGSEFSIKVSRADGGKCVRCWGYFENLGSDPLHPELCPRCSSVINGDYGANHEIS